MAREYTFSPMKSSCVASDSMSPGRMSIPARTASWSTKADGVPAVEERVEEPGVHPGVVTLGGLDIARILGRRVGRLHVEGRPDGRAGRRGAHGPDRLGVGEVDDVAGTQRQRGIAEARGVLAGGMAHEHEDLRLVEDRPGPDAVAERAHDGVRVLGEPADDRTVRPASRVLDPLREVPVEQGRVGGDAARQQLVDQAVVVVEPGALDHAIRGGDDPRPGDAEAVCAEAQPAQDRHVLAGSGGTGRRRRRRWTRRRSCPACARTGPRSIRPCRPRCHAPSTW